MSHTQTGVLFECPSGLQPNTNDGLVWFLNLLLLLTAPSLGFYFRTVGVPKSQRISQSDHMEEGLEKKERRCLH